MTYSYVHCYATANDDKYYIEDIKNLVRIARTDSGVAHIDMYIAISCVNDISACDRFFSRGVHKLFAKHKRITLKKLIFKPNQGRDFSSYEVLSQFVMQSRSDGDYVLFQNRSACGPYLDGWFKRYVEVYSRDESVALCGSTINFLDHPDRSSRNDLPHVQTYAFLTQVCHLKRLPKDFPGAKETERLNIILNGEIGLSQYFLGLGFSINCLEWPDLVVKKGDLAFVSADCKEVVSKNHPFYHRHYISKNQGGKIRNGLLSCFWVYIKACFIMR